ncbi:MAG: glycosyltransferase family 2 protein [Arenimonas sp.]
MQSVLNSTVSLVIPVYQNEGSIADLTNALEWLNKQMDSNLEVVFVVDGSRDQSYALLQDALAAATFKSQLITLSRNFGAFAAIRCGLEKANGKYIAVMAADLQEPIDLIPKFFSLLQQEQHDVVFGVREARQDPWLSKLASKTFWAIYRYWVMPEIPAGGVDVFAVSDRFRQRLVQLRESNSSLLAQLFWLGGRRAFVGYERQQRKHGKSAWTFRKKIRYFSDSIFSFTDLPVRLLIGLGTFSFITATLLSTITLFAKLSGLVAVPGYAGTMLTILFFGALNSLGLGVVGTYAWRAYENTKSRPLALIQSEETFEGKSP